MIRLNAPEFYDRRATQARQMANSASSEAIATIHRTMALEYDALAQRAREGGDTPLRVTL